MEDGLSEARVSLRVIEAEIVEVLRRLKALAGGSSAPATDALGLEAILHLGEALHEVQQALAHTRRGEGDWGGAVPVPRPASARRVLALGRGGGEERGQA